MRHLLTAVLFAFSFHAAAAQSLEQKIAAKSCECLEKEKAVTEPILRDCLSRSLTAVILADSSKKYLRQLSTVEGVQRTTKGAYRLLAKQCKMVARPRED